ncbi:MAG: alpha/beta fold hydrolase [Alphaproteobacteria bacterium]|jgi:pimeloyl-ACP methyl ester carboxylesterase
MCASMTTSITHASDFHPTYEELSRTGMIQTLAHEDLQKKFLETSAGKLAYYETTGTGDTLLLIHGNSTSKEYMIRQLDELGTKYKMLALDLPGHGESDNAVVPLDTYTLAGYGRVCCEFIEKLNLGPVTVVGWSLGGHIAMEMMAENPSLLRGVLIACAPPFTPSENGLKEAYLPTYSTPLSMKIDPFTLEDTKSYITQGVIDFEKYPLLAKASMRAHGLARHTMVSAVLKGEGRDERQVVERSCVPLGILMAKQDHAINNDYTASLAYANCVMMETLDGPHDCQWSHPEAFNKVIVSFVEKCKKKS